MSKAQLIRLLTEALRGRRRRAVRLAGILQPGIDSFVLDRDNATSRRERLLRQVHAADQIIKDAQRLLDCLQVHELEVRRAVSDNCLTAAERSRCGNYSSLGEMMGWMTWKEGEECRLHLKRLVNGAAH